MLLEGLSLENYGVYGETAEVDLSTTRAKPIVLIGGMNGAGKTTMFESIMVALYGRAYLGSKATKAQYNEFIMDRIHRGKSGRRASSASVEVRFRFYHDGSEDGYAIRRGWNVEGASASESMEIRKNGEVMSDVDESMWQSFIDGIIPMGVSRLFFFDGEKIVRVTEWDQANNDEIQASLDVLLGTELVNRLASDLDLYVMRASGSGGQEAEAQARYKDLRREMQSLAAEISSLDAAISEKKAELEAALSRISAKEMKLAGAGGGYADMRGDLLAKKAAAEEGARRQLKDILEGLSGDAPLCLAGGLLQELEQQVRSDVSVAQRKSSASLMRDRIESLKKEFSSKEFWFDDPVNDTVLSKINSRLDDMAREPSEREFFDMSPNDAEWMMRKIEGAKGAPENLIALLEEHAETLEGLGKAELDLARIPRDDELGPKITEINSLHEEAGMLKGEIAGMEQTLSAKRAHEKILQSKLKGLVDSIHKSGAASRGVDLASRMKAALATYHGRIRERKFRSLEERLLGMARTLMHKDLISRIEVDRETFEIRVFGNGSDEPMPGGALSMGERQMVGTALLWAIARTCNRPLPFVIDTPLGRLDGEHLDSLVERFYPHASHQTILLSTDREIGEKEYSRLAKHVRRSYTISYEPSGAAARVEEGYHVGGARGAA